MRRWATSRQSWRTSSATSNVSERHQFDPANRHYETSHLPGAINLPYAFVDEAEKVLRDKRAEIVVYSMNEECEASSQEARQLEKMGYENVVHLAGGKQDRLPSARSSRASSSRDGSHAYGSRTPGT